MKTLKTYTSEHPGIFLRVKKALENLNWNYETNEEINQIVVNFGINLYTWGSTMVIDKITDKQVNIKISTKLPTQIIDWGDGENKFEKLIFEIQKLENS